jgi:transcriptional regulator with XRE-family HTH domain
MGQASREKPARLQEKLRQIREALGLSQGQMIARLGLSGRLSQNNISAFERGTREPSLPVLVRYARVAGVWIDALADDDLDLPAHLPSKHRSPGVPRKNVSRNKKP